VTIAGTETTTTDTSRGPVKEGHPHERRMVRFDWSGTPLHWVPDDPFSTHMINVLHLLLPAGERWFIGVVNEATPYVEDPELLDAIKPFVQQESWHAWAHTAVLEHLAEHGIESAPFTKSLENWFAKIGSPKPSWPEPLQRWWLHRRLAEVAAIEHFTAVLGQWVIQTQALDYAGADPVMLDLLRWHGAEEIEHRSLVFDVYQNICGSYPLRCFGMMFTAPALLGWWLHGVRYLMSHDPSARSRPTWRQWFRSARQFRVPSPWMLIVTTPLRYMRPRHHPLKEATTDLALRYLEQSPAARRAQEARAHAAAT
jgi:predicted metal-dependent hydrolase